MNKEKIKPTIKLSKVKLLFDPKFKETEDGLIFKCKTIGLDELTKYFDARYKKVKRK